jgi:hypothetical protein
VLGFSFSVHLLNILATFTALIFIGALALLAFRIKAKFVAISVGSVAVFAWLLLALGMGAVMLLDGNSAVTVALEDGQYCEETVYGFVTGDSGEELAIYRRYLFIDQRIYHGVHSDVYPNDVTRVSTSLASLLARCQAKINKKRLGSASYGRKRPVPDGHSL